MKSAICVAHFLNKVKNILQSEKYFEEVQKRWDEEERKLAEEHPR